MSISFPVPSQIDASLPPLQIFQSHYKVQEKNSLLQRIQTLIPAAVPLHFSVLLEGVCHCNFKVTVHDAALIQDLKRATLFFKNHPEKSDEAIIEASWQKIADKLDVLIQEKAAFPLHNLPFDILLNILSYLSLSELSKLIQGTSIKVFNTQVAASNAIKKKQHYSVIRDDVLGEYPLLILKTVKSQAFFQAQACHQLSKVWFSHNQPALLNLFSLLHDPRHRLVRHYYLIQLRDKKLFDAFLAYPAPKDNILLLDILPSSYPSKLKSGTWALPPLLQPSSYRLEDWQKLITSQMHVESLSITTKLDDDLTIQQRKELLLKTIAQLQNVKNLELYIQNLAQTLPAYFPSQLNFYREFIQRFPALETLALIDREIKESKVHSEKEKITAYQYFNLLVDGERKLNILTNNMQKLLHQNLKIKHLSLDVDCFPHIPIKTLEEHCHSRNRPYSIFYLYKLLPVIQVGFTLKNISTIQITIPKPLTLPNFNDILASPQLKLHLLPGTPSMNVGEDKLTFVFKIVSFS